jgi:hypothetical protein
MSILSFYTDLWCNWEGAQHRKSKRDEKDMRTIGQTLIKMKNPQKLDSALQAFGIMCKNIHLK